MGQDAYHRRPTAVLPPWAPGAVTYVGGMSLTDPRLAAHFTQQGTDANLMTLRLLSGRERVTPAPPRLPALLREIEAEGFYKGPRFPFERVWFRRY